MRARSRPSSGERGYRGRGHLAPLFAAAVAWHGCGGDATEAPSLPHPAILVEPADADVFEGQQALFQVRAAATNGTTYQWRRDGAAIPGAVDSHYRTPPSAPSDDGGAYSVVVTNGGAASLESRRAVLTVHPPIDLRFKWVGAPRPLQWVLRTALLASGWSLYHDAAGTPLLVGAGTCAGLLNCAWIYAVALSPGTTVKYEAGPIGWLSDASSSTDMGLSVLPPTSVVTSLDLQPGDAQAYAMSCTGSTQVGAFTPVVHDSVPLDQLQAVASSEGALGRVLTAVSSSGGLVTYVSHGWTLSAGTIYEAQVVPSTLASAAADATALASRGYVITAFGAGEDAVNGVVLVGSRAQGSTAPRTITVSDRLPSDPGAGVVGAFRDPATSTWQWIVEQ